eukprot:TRINITY_DN7322_c0_g1_i1.p1 TRINITY_DN7322_c0_g1~~TRINITY_DN7322_c0_g1_i1.p1  ORF type:complete len:323 (+),score=47.74 TRINITY_DN7322_c0_g1_i1:177-1145(+)
MDFGAKVNSMIEGGIDRDEYGLSPLHYTMRTDDIETVQRAKDNMTRLEPEPEGLSSSPLFLQQSNTRESLAHAGAFFTDQPELLEELFNGLEPNLIMQMIKLQNDALDTSLHTAVKLNKEEICALLKERGTNTDDFSLLNICNKVYLNVLHFVSAHGLLGIANVLFRGVPYEIRIVPDESKIGWTPLHHAAMRDDASLMGAILDDLDNDQKSFVKIQRTHITNDIPLHYTVRNKCIETTRMLLADSEPRMRECQNYMGFTALHIAVEANNVEMVRILLNESRPEFWKITPNAGQHILDIVNSDEQGSEATRTVLQIHIDNNP